MSYAGRRVPADDDLDEEWPDDEEGYSFDDEFEDDPDDVEGEEVEEEVEEEEEEEEV